MPVIDQSRTRTNNSNLNAKISRKRLCHVDSFKDDGFDFIFLLTCLSSSGFRRNSNVVHLRGLPFSVIESDVAAFFRGLELGPNGVVICVNFKGFFYTFSLFPISMFTYKN
jgi:hypothetical protein